MGNLKDILRLVYLFWFGVDKWVIVVLTPGVQFSPIIYHEDKKLHVDDMVMISALH
jgi:hypothetical protein